MLRTSLRSVRGPSGRPVTATLGRQWVNGTVRVVHKRPYASKPNKPSIDYPKPQPKSEPLSKSAPASASTSSPTSTSTPAPNAKFTAPPPPKKSIFRRLRNLVLTLTILGGLSFGGGVWYSRINDNFHDFFTEYIPFGDRAVGYFEELDFRKRFPESWNRTAKPVETGGQVTIPASSGASWRVADGDETVGRRHSAVDKTAKTVKVAKASEADPKETGKTDAKEKPAAKAPEKTVGKKAEMDQKPPERAPQVAKPASEPQPKRSQSTKFKQPEVDEPSRFPPIARIDPLNVPDAGEPMVQDLVRMVNDVITVINADNAQDRYRNTMAKAKGEVAKVGQSIKALRSEAEKAAAADLKSKVDEFENLAKDLNMLVETAMDAQERMWRKDFEEEMSRVRESYDEKAKVLLEREKRVHEEQLRNRLLEQAVALKKEFVANVKQQVEDERSGRLGRLDELSSAVSELEKLTSGWNDVVDKNLQTQQLHVAVDAVRASLENAQHPRPFVKELVALKQVANGDAVIDAAISSINPSAYQKGVSTPSQLIDRFRRVASEVRKASLLPEDAGVASHASSWMLSKVMFKKEGLAAGDDVESILTRTQTHLEEGDLDAAAREMNGLSGWAKTLSRDWLGEVRKVLEVQQALDVITTEARLQSLRVE